MQKEIKEEECDYSFKSKQLLQQGNVMLAKLVFGKIIQRERYQRKLLQQQVQNLKQNLSHFLMDQEQKPKFGIQVLNDYRKLDKKDIVLLLIGRKYIIDKQSHFRKVVGALAIFDLTNKTSLEKLQLWIQELKHHGDGDIQIIIIGNKLDLVQKNPSCRQVSENDIKLFIKQNKWKIFEISAHLPENVNQCFETLFIDLCKQKTGFRGGEQSQLKLMKQSANLNEGKCKC
ncbi:unnamed protein product [Paramecium sonneborni]|uniref:Uncharacterized protein n=1 Tax=Paramecium sonneborni TaxID=65129 RepID=A0A8S1P5L5_9CILI|nr:unnamed protein product [Paramecium sonneborni]